MKSTLLSFADRSSVGRLRAPFVFFADRSSFDADSLSLN